MSRKMSVLLIIIIFVFIIFVLGGVTVQGLGNTYYVCDNAADCNAGGGSGWSTGDDTNNCSSKATPCKTIKGGIEKLSSGDTLIIGDGVYTGVIQVLCGHDDDGGSFI